MTTRLDTARRMTDGGIPYVLMEGYPTLNVEVNGVAKGTEKYLIRASDIESFIAESIPVAYVAGVQVFWPIRRRMPGTDILITQAISFEPHNAELPCDPFNADSDADPGTYGDLMVATIEYSTDMESDNAATPRDPASPETYLEHSFDVGMMIVDNSPKNCFVGDVPIGTFTIPGDLKAYKPLDMPPPKRVPVTTHQFNWSFALRLNWTVIRQSLGKVNSTTLKMFNNAPPETVLFESVSGRRVFSWNGRNTVFQPYQITFVFNEIFIEEQNTRYGWNHKWDASGKWLKVFRKSSGIANYVPMYEGCEFRNMFVASV